MDQGSNQVKLLMDGRGGANFYCFMQMIIGAEYLNTVAYFKETFSRQTNCKKELLSCNHLPEPQST